MKIPYRCNLFPPNTRWPRHLFVRKHITYIQRAVCFGTDMSSALVRSILQKRRESDRAECFSPSTTCWTSIGFPSCSSLRDNKIVNNSQTDTKSSPTTRKIRRIPSWHHHKSKSACLLWKPKSPIIWSSNWKGRLPDSNHEICNFKMSNSERMKNVIDENQKKGKNQSVTSLTTFIRWSKTF